MGAGERLADEWGVPVSQRKYRDLDVSALPSQAVAAGAAMELDEAVEYALEGARA